MSYFWCVLGIVGLLAQNLQAQPVRFEPEQGRLCRFYFDLLYGYTLYEPHTSIAINFASPVQRHTGQDYGTRLRFQYSLPFYRQVYLGASAAYRLRAVDLWVNKPLIQGPGAQRILEYRAQHVNLDASVGYRHRLDKQLTWQTEFAMGVEGAFRLRNRQRKSFFGVGVTQNYPYSLYAADQAPHPDGGNRVYDRHLYYMYSIINETPPVAWSLATGFEYCLSNGTRLYLGLAYRQFTSTRLENYFLIQDALDYPVPSGVERAEYSYRGPLSTLFLHLGIGF